MKFNQKAFIDFILHHKIIHISQTPIQLKSGAQSHLYINWRTVASDVYTLDQLADFILSFVDDQKIQSSGFFGVPEGATKLGIVTSYKLAQNSLTYGPGSHVLSMGRGRPKEHGQSDDRYFLGHPSGQRIVVLEDVTTTGDSLVKTIDHLKEAGAHVVAALTLTNRHPNPEHLTHRFLDKCPFYSLSTLNDILDGYLRGHENPNEIRKVLDQEWFYSQQEATHGI